MNYHTAEYNIEAVTEHVEKQFGGFASLPNAELQGRHLTLKFGEYETLMHNGLVELQANINRGKAHSMFLEAAAIAPEEYLPCLMAFSCFPESKDSAMLLYDACERNPNAISAFIGLGENLANKGEFVASLELFQKAISIFPDYDIPYRRLATVFNKLGYTNEAKSFERMAASRVGIVH